MAKFRKKPVVVEAVQWPVTDATRPDWLPDITLEVPTMMDITWAQMPPGKLWLCAEFPECVYIGTMEGAHRCEPRDWIIRDIKGELYPCKPDIFAATYEPADALATPDSAP